MPSGEHVAFTAFLSVYSQPAVLVTTEIVALYCNGRQPVSLIACCPRHTFTYLRALHYSRVLPSQVLRVLPAGKLLGCLGSGAEEQRSMYLATLQHNARVAMCRGPCSAGALHAW